MAREFRPHKSQNKVTVVEPPKKRGTHLPGDAGEPTYRHVPQQGNSSSVRRPVLEPTNFKDAPKPPRKQRVSIAGVFKKPQKNKANRASKKQQRRREPTPELDLIGDLQESINAARAHLSSTAKATFTSLHGTFNSKLQTIHEEDTAFLQHVSETVATLSTPLVGEKIETEIRQGGKRFVETVEIGKRVAAFKALVEKEEEKLKQSWKEWDEVQEEYIELGINVFGAEVFGRGEEERGGYSKEMMLMELEHNARVEELEEEISEIGGQALQDMKTSEKELDAATKREQARLLQALL